MDTTTGVSLDGFSRREARIRVVSVIAALALVLAAFVLVQPPAHASPAPTAPVAAAVVGGAAIGGANPQFAIVCSILSAIRAAFQSTPFFGFVVDILDSLLSSFGCEISGG